MSHYDNCRDGYCPVCGQGPGFFEKGLDCGKPRCPNNKEDQGVTGTEAGYVEQVGGRHYASEYQHWDWVEDTGMGYLEGCATKYIVRWWKKNGVEDLMKARSYVEKLVERHTGTSRVSKILGYLWKRTNRSTWGVSQNLDLLDQFVAFNNLGTLEMILCYELATWKTVEELTAVMVTLEDMILKEERQDAVTGPGTPEDGGHHARQPTPEIDD